MQPGYTVGVFSPALGGDFWAMAVAGVQDVINREGGRVIAVSGPPETLGASVVANNLVDGWVVIYNTDGIEHLSSTGKPIVLVNASVAGLPFPTVLPDNRSGTQELIHHLIGHGHTRIACLGYLPDEDMRLRYEGYRAALEEAGLPPDPALVISFEPNNKDGIHAAVAQLIAAGMPCTAIFSGYDEAAVLIIEDLRAAGYHVPEDVAVVGFDDLPKAQFIDPPLTTVRQQIREQGVVAGQLLLDLLAGRPVVERTYVPTALIVRRSCGSVPLQPYQALIDLNDREAWRTAMIYRLAQLVRAPLPEDPHLAPETIWPGIGVVVDALAAALDGNPPPDAGVLERAWRAAAARTSDIEALLTIAALIEENGLMVGAIGAAQVRDLAANARQELMRAGLNRSRQTIDLLSRLVEDIHHISLELFEQSEAQLAGSAGSARELVWMAHTGELEACLGLWDASGRMLEIAGVYPAANAQQTITQQFPAASFPPAALLADMQKSVGKLIKILAVRTPSRNWGMLAMCGMLEDFTYSDMLASLLATALEREQLQRSLQAQQADLQTGYERERALADAVRTLGSPVIPLLPGLLLVPLVGSIFSDRAQQIMASVLAGVIAQQADTVLLDITGVPVVDTQVAAALVHTAQAAGLLGATTYLVGVRPEIAQSIISLGVDLSTLRSSSSLATALAELGIRRVR